MHVYCLLQINSFGVSEKSLVRCGNGLYSPSNLINHSCSPNCVGVYRGRTQFIIAIRDIKPGEQISLSYIDIGI